MDNTERSDQAAVEAAGELVATARRDTAAADARGAAAKLAEARSAKCEVKTAVRSLVERFGLSREDLVSAYEECVQEMQHGREVRVEKNGTVAAGTAVVVVEPGEEDELLREDQELPSPAEQPSTHSRTRCTASSISSSAGESLHSINGAPSPELLDIVSETDESGAPMEAEEEGEQQEEEDDSRQQQWQQNGTAGAVPALVPARGVVLGRAGSVSSGPPLEEKEEVDKMQTLVQSALRVYEASSMQAEIGQKRRCHFSLEDELTLQPSPFAQELLDRDQTVVAHAIKKYMNQYSVPQREVVEKTGLNQSHLSQHFLHGVTMKSSKRVKLYHWFEDDQRIRTGKPSTADTALNSVLESPKVEGSRRRPRWKWSPISTQILSEAFKKNHFPTREQRVELARVCNEAELTMNNGSPIRGPEGDTEGITEQRVNTWFTNRRKGLSTPSPTRGGLAMGHGGAIFNPAIPPLLRAATPTTPTHSYSHTPDLDRSEDRFYSTPAPATVQTLVGHVQHVQAAASSGSAVQLTGTPTAAAQALPLTTITLPHGSVLAPRTSLTAISQPTSAPPPLQTYAITPEGIPALIPPSQLQAILSQVQASADSSIPTQIQLANTSGGIFTIPMLHPQKVTAPPQLHTYTVTPTSVTVAKSSSTSPLSPSHSYSTFHSPTLTALPTLTQSQAPVHASVPTIIGSNQVQALLSSLQAQAKLQGLPHVHFNHANSLPLAIAVPGGSSREDILRAQAVLVNHHGPSD